LSGDFLAPAATVAVPIWLAQKVESALLGRGAPPPPRVAAAFARLGPDVRRHALRLANLLVCNQGRLSTCTTWVRLRPEPNLVAPIFGFVFLDEDRVACFGARGDCPPPLEPFFARRLGERPWEDAALSDQVAIHAWASKGRAA
jgi:hypothetical protein